MTRPARMFFLDEAGVIHDETARYREAQEVAKHRVIFTQILDKITSTLPEQRDGINAQRVQTFLDELGIRQTPAVYLKRADVPAFAQLIKEELKIPPSRLD
jgi:hypothetical protein